MEPPHLPKETLAESGARTGGKCFSPVPRITQMSPQAHAIPPLRAENPQRRDSVPEQSEFELPVPVSKLSDDTVLLQFTKLRRVGLKAQNSKPVRHYCRNLEGKRSLRAACSEYVSVRALDGQLSEI
jgi:hypothetical protein